MSHKGSYYFCENYKAYQNALSKGLDPDSEALGGDSASDITEPSGKKSKP